MFSQRFSRSTAIRRNSFGYRPFRLLATCSSFPCKVCHFRLSQNRGSVHAKTADQSSSKVGKCFRINSALHVGAQRSLVPIVPVISTIIPHLAAKPGRQAMTLV